MDTEKFFKCSCQTELLGVTNDTEDKLIYLAMYLYGHQNHELTWKERFKYCWRVLRGGRGFNDEFLLDYDTAKELGNFLLKATKL